MTGALHTAQEAVEVPERQLLEAAHQPHPSRWTQLSASERAVQSVQHMPEHTRVPRLLQLSSVVLQMPSQY
jgi:hypothetical protein